MTKFVKVKFKIYLSYWINMRKLAEIKIDTSNGLNSIKFNKDKCVKNGLLEKTENIKLYSNLYPIKFTKDIEICEYPFTISQNVTKKV